MRELQNAASGFVFLVRNLLSTSCTTMRHQHMRKGVGFSMNTWYLLPTTFRRELKPVAPRAVVLVPDMPSKPSCTIRPSFINISERVLWFIRSQGFYDHKLSGEITKNMWHLELWFLYERRLLNLVYNPTKYHKYI